MNVPQSSRVAARLGRHHMITAIGQQMDFWDGRVWVAEHPHDGTVFDGGRMGGGTHFCRVRMQGCAAFGHPFLQQQRGRPHLRIRHKAPLHRLLQ